MTNTTQTETKTPAAPAEIPCTCGCKPWQGIDISAEEAALLNSDRPEAGDAFIAHWAQIAADKCGELVYVVSPGNKTEYIRRPRTGALSPSRDAGGRGVRRPGARPARRVAIVGRVEIALDF